MHQIQFHTLADQLGSCVDGRVLYLNLEYCNVPFELMKETAIAFYQFTSDFYQDQFVSQWCFSGGERLYYPRDVIRELKDDRSIAIFNVEANVKTPSCYSKMHFREFKRRLLYDTTLRRQEYALDFDAYYKSRIEPVLMDAERLREATIKLFLEQDRKPFLTYNTADSNGGFFSMPEQLGSTYYHGSLSLSIAVGCLGDRLNHAAKIFADELQNLCVLLGTASGRVSVCPYAYAIGNNVYTRYYRERDLPVIDEEMPERILPHNWNRVAYLRGFEWANVLSPQAAKKIAPALVSKSAEGAVSVEMLSNHGAFVQLNMPIDAVDVDDLLILKRFLYPALYPGKSSTAAVTPVIRGLTPAQFFPRCRWERIPFFPEEIKVENGLIIFEKCVVLPERGTDLSI